jgi:uncharacterized membrane protein
MLLLIIGLGIVAFIIGGILMDTFTEYGGGFLMTISAIVVVISCIAMMFILGPCIRSATIDERIEMYQEENAKIEAQIAEVVTQYQEYETGIFTEVSPDSAMTLVALYPDLKSDTLVSSQIDIYVQNNEKIKELKVEQINGHLYRWWVYFGK